jgi:hypothetical protein
MQVLTINVSTLMETSVFDSCFLRKREWPNGQAKKKSSSSDVTLYNFFRVS